MTSLEAGQAYYRARAKYQPLRSSDPDRQARGPSDQEAVRRGRSYTFMGHASDSSGANPAAVATADRVHASTQSCFASCTYGGSVTTKIAKAMVLGAAAGLIAFFVCSNPVGWAVGIAVGVFAVSLIAMQVLHTVADKRSATQINRAFSPEAPTVSFKQMAQFRWSAWRRLGNKNFNHVHTAPNGSRIFLGALPNKKDPSYLRRMNHERIGAVLSLNEPWERRNFADSVPFTRDDWAAARKDYRSIDALDHYYLNFDQLDQAADFINAELVDGKNVYVHCKSGMGRSAMAIAAYMIKYEKMTPDQAARQIEHGDRDKRIEGRSISTIKNKLDRHPKKGDGLRAYHNLCRQREQEPRAELL